MKISEIKVIHVVFVLLFVVLGFIIFEIYRMQYQFAFSDWQRNATQVINNLTWRIDALEKGKIALPPGPPAPQAPRK